MLKRLLLLIPALALILSTASCGVFWNPTEKYLIALQNMVKADSMESNAKFEMHIDLSKAKDDVKSEWEKFEDVTMNIDEAVNREEKKQAHKYFINAGGTPLDFKVYIDGENGYFKSAFTGDKYYKLEEMEGERNAEETEPKSKEDSEELKKFFDEIKEIWTDAVKNEIVSREGTSVENTPDGDIKVSNLTLELTDEKGKNILSRLAGALSGNSFMKEQAIKGSARYAPKSEKREDVNKAIEDWFKNLPDYVQESKDKYTLDKLKLTAKVDSDSYIIKQGLSGGLTIKGEGEIKVDFNFEETYWNINGKVKVDIPQIKSGDIGDWKDIESDDSDFAEKFKDNFNVK